VGASRRLRFRLGCLLYICCVPSAQLRMDPRDKRYSGAASLIRNSTGGRLPSRYCPSGVCVCVHPRLPQPRLMTSTFTWCWKTLESAARASRETDEERSDRRTLITDLIDGQYLTWRALSPSTPPRAGRAGRDR
jgi:hypothetical protein